MAVIKLGALVSGIAGSIGGTTFRRGNGYISASNKSSGPSKSRLRTNAQLGGNVDIVQLWNTIGQPEKDQWNAQAQLFQFPDKFGTLRNITGRQLFIKLNARRNRLGMSVPSNPATLDSATGSLTDMAANIRVSGSTFNTADIEFFYENVPQNTRFIFSVQLRTKNARFFNFAKFSLFAGKTISVGGSGEDSLSALTQFENKFGTTTEGQRFLIAGVLQNPSGFRSVPFQIFQDVEPAP